ncbi:ATP-dependent DNA ligase [Cyclobacterium marinum]|uniref:ATP-dependent DNA ligase n=1 Tax=Cyclobacterium marinum TaxID=104 RepID=UPI0011EF2EDF|nr:ATP-dependent DNA ligase [Cyclobacterium marinum]MBI0397494.1 ATP-dependent DNA ligase [Cyclobacterium marinum]
MKDFVRLFIQLDQTTKTLKKVAALVEYFDNAEESDKLWTIAILSHKRPKRTVRTSLLRSWAASAANVPLWLFEESYHIVGDLAETMALMHPNLISKHNKSLSEWISFIINLKNLEDDQTIESANLETKRQKVLWAWDQLDETERFVFNKLMTGSWRVGVSQKLMTRALAQHSGIDENTLSHRLMGNWSAETSSYHQLIIETDPADKISQPYPFYLAYGLENEIHELGKPKDWLAERKWDGIRGQLIIRENQLFLWSRGEELITDKFPEFEILIEKLPNGTVIDGEIIAYQLDQPLGFNVLQSRIGRKNVSKSILDKAPVVMIAYDLLELNGKDIRESPLHYRRQELEKLVKQGASEKLLISEVVQFNEWEDLIKERADSRIYHAEGLMLKSKFGTYKVGRKKGDWWKWKIDPLTIDAVLLYAMRGHGRRANLYTDYTFAVWKGNELVPFAKAYSGLTDKEINEVDAFVKRNTIERFGPVRSVKPALVFEIAFEGIARSSRHKSGVALRFPRMHRWRKDKPVHEANTLEDLELLLNLYG